MIYQKIFQVQLKHFVQLVVCILAIYLLRVRKTYQLVPSWKSNLDPSKYKNGRFPVIEERLPPPIVTDVDDDGSLEVVFVKTDLILEIGRVPPFSEGSRLPHTMVIATRQLPRIVAESGSLARPVVMETGYLDRYTSEDQARTQVIMVLFSNWHLVCYDHELSLLWEQTVMDVGLLTEDYRVQSMAILVTPHQIQREDRGLVIVGGNFVHKHDKQHETTTREHLPLKNHSGNTEDIFKKFSMFAFDGGNGTARWYHLPGSSVEDITSSPQSTHHWKLSLKRGHWPHGRVHWSRFGTYLLQHTPHHWHHTHHTTLDLADLRNRQDAATGSSDRDHSSLVDLSLSRDHTAGRTYGGMRAHSRHEHIANPDVVVARHHTGLELLSLHTGRLVTDLRLDAADSVYADVNDDTQLDQVKVTFAGACLGEWSTIHPRPRALFSQEVCGGGGSAWPLRYSDPSPVTEDTHVKVAPVVVRSVARHRGLLNHLLGRALAQERSGYDSIFMTSSGTVTSVGPQGQLNWKTAIPAKWSERTRAAAHHKYRDTPMGAVFYNGFTPSLLAYSLLVHGSERSALVSGWDQIVMVDLTEGYLEAQHSLPCQPLQEPVIADFNGDGWNDIIVTCPNGFVGLSVQPQPQYIYMTVLSVTIVLVMLLLSWCCQVDESERHEYFSSEEED